MVLTYDRKKILAEKKGTEVCPAMFFGGFKLQPEKITTRKKKGTVVWPTVEIHVPGGTVGYPAQLGLTWRNRQVTQHNQD